MELASGLHRIPTVLRDAEGRIIGGINVLIDITERKMRTEK